MRNVCHVGGQPQFDLAVVGAEDLVAGVCDECIADLAPGLGADRDVLQVRVVGRQPSGLSAV